jgi:hypothetical protein
MINPKIKINTIIKHNKKANRISYVVFGDLPQYSLGIFHNLAIAKNIYPGWIPRIYTDKIDHRCNFYEEMGAEVFVVNDNLPAITWRTLSIDDHDCEKIIFRDADSLLSLREKVAVDEWISSKKTFHRMKETPHIKTMPILAGMWGVDSNVWRARFGNFYRTIKNFLKDKSYDQASDNQETPDRYRSKLDEKFLSEYVWNLAKDDIYSSGFSDRYGSAIPFKIEYKTYNNFSIEECNFIGSRIYNYKWFR